MSKPPSVGPALPSSFGKDGKSDERPHSDRKKRRRSESSSSSSSDSNSSSSSSSSDSYHRHKHRKSKRHRHSRSSRSRRPPGAPELFAEDFFRYASEYREWLLSRRGIHSSSLTTDEARSMFGDFARAWNKGKLSARYYSGIEPTSIASSSRTDHKWSFSGVDSGQLHTIRNEVNRATTAGKSSTVTDYSEDLLEPFGPSAAPKSLLPPPTLSRPTSSSNRDWASEREDRERQYDREKKERRDYRRTLRDAEEDVAPRATGRDRIYEKRREENSARRAHESERHGDRTIDPYDDSETRSILAREAAQHAFAAKKRAEKDSALAERRSAAQAKEDATMAALRQMARDAGHKVT